jgi:hypothetical protein
MQEGSMAHGRLPISITEVFGETIEESERGTRALEGVACGPTGIMWLYIFVLVIRVGASQSSLASRRSHLAMNLENSITSLTARQQ